eukprot:7456630-Pyramimonas_sp.AAC.1
MRVRTPTTSNGLGECSKTAQLKMLAVHPVMQPLKFRKRSTCCPYQCPSAQGKPGGNGGPPPRATELKPRRNLEGAEGDPERPGEGDQLLADKPPRQHAELSSTGEHKDNSCGAVDRQSRDRQLTPTN